MKKKAIEKKETTTISLEISVYTQLEHMKIIPQEPFSEVIKRIIVENNHLKREVKCGEEVNPLIQNSEQKPKSA